MVKNPPAVPETWVPSLGREDPLEKSMATLSSILAWKIPWTEEPGGLQSTGRKLDPTERLSTRHRVVNSVERSARTEACDGSVTAHLCCAPQSSCSGVLTLPPRPGPQKGLLLSDRDIETHQVRVSLGWALIRLTVSS